MPNSAEQFGLDFRCLVDNFEGDWSTLEEIIRDELTRAAPGFLSNTEVVTEGLVLKAMDRAMEGDRTWLRGLVGNRNWNSSEWEEEAIRHLAEGMSWGRPVALLEELIAANRLGDRGVEQLWGALEGSHGGKRVCTLLARLLEKHADRVEEWQRFIKGASAEGLFATLHVCRRVFKTRTAEELVKKVFVLVAERDANNMKAPRQAIADALEIGFLNQVDLSAELEQLSDTRVLETWSAIATHHREKANASLQLIGGRERAIIFLKVLNADKSEEVLRVLQWEIERGVFAKLVMEGMTNAEKAQILVRVPAEYRASFVGCISASRAT